MTQDNEKDQFESWLRGQKESARQSYQDDDAPQPLGENYELGMYHAYRKVLDHYLEADEDTLD